LQSVILGKTRAVALIDGVTVAVGERYQGARLIEVKPAEVVLRGAKGDTIVLRLTPEVHKQQLAADTEIIQK